MTVMTRKPSARAPAFHAGGFTPRASKDKVTVTRKMQGAPMRFALPMPYPLRPGDTIEVSERWF